MKKILIQTGFIALFLSACATNPYTGEREASNTGKGAAIGAAVGAVIGALTGKEADNRRKRALIGAGVGALGGAAVGSYMDKQESKLREQLRDSGVSVTRMGDDLVLNMPGNITFGIDRTELRDEFLPVLDSVVLVLKEYNQTLIDVTGHTDSTGTRAHNMDLSVRRANSVANYLRGGGVNPNRMHTLGVGPDHPVAENTSAAGRQLNRRVELVLKPLTKEGEV
ncbi:MAG: OmpA family protein [Gammaproteobacteria bacterium]|nr:OmpA family protein [Gammaproteobacteria bacterium]